jgi:ribosomal protein S27E
MARVTTNPKFLTIECLDCGSNVYDEDDVRVECETGFTFHLCTSCAKLLAEKLTCER